MRIADLNFLFAVVWLTAFLWLECAANNLTFSHSSRKFHDHLHISQQIMEEEKYQFLTYREIQNIIRDESGETGNPVDCCPSVVELTRPDFGRNQQQLLVNIYQGESGQRFFESTCRQDIANKPCRFIDRKLFHQSRCVQKYSWTSAIVESVNASQTNHHHRHSGYQRFHLLGDDSAWTIDHISIRSGCTCEISPKPKKKKNLGLRSKKLKTKKKNDGNF